MHYGNPPKILGEVDLKPTEHMIYLYLPIMMPDDFRVYLPERLKFTDILIRDCLVDSMDRFSAVPFYVYLTVKTCWVEAGAPGNRPGWHVDGYGSDGDWNYVWHSMNPTEFAVQEFKDVPDDDFGSLAAFEKQVLSRCIVTYPDRTLLRLDESVVHRVNPNPKPGVRTFVKVSVSQHRYNLKGNSHNYLVDYDWDMYDREEFRNMDNKDFVK